MNKQDWTEIEGDCNVCGASVEVGTASSRCSNRDCPTRVRGGGLDTDSDDEEVAVFYIRDRAMKMDLDRKTIDIDAEQLAAQTMAGSRNCHASLLDLWEAAEELLDHGATTKITEDQWVCGICGDADVLYEVTDGTELLCDNCGNERTVRFK